MWYIRKRICFKEKIAKSDIYSTYVLKIFKIYKFWFEKICLNCVWNRSLLLKFFHTSNTLSVVKFASAWIESTRRVQLYATMLWNKQLQHISEDNIVVKQLTTIFSKHHKSHKQQCLNSGYYDRIGPRLSQNKNKKKLLGSENL